MKKNIFFALFSAILLMTACQQHEIDSPADFGDGFTLMGHSDAQTKTAFGTPGGETIPFLWSEGDIICVNGVESNPLSIGGASAEFTFSEGSVTEGDDVYYGQLIDDEVWVLPFQEGDPAELLDDFGHAKVGKDNTFTLQHYTSYLWLNPYSTEVTGEGKKVSSVTIKAANNIVGKSTFDATNKSFGEISSAIVDPEAPELAQTKELLLEFWDDGEAKPKALPAASSDVDIWAVAVVFPVTTGEIEVIYNFEDGSMASYTHSTKTLEAGRTYRLTHQIMGADVKKPQQYELRVLTFEDEDAKFEPYDCTFSIWGNDETKFVEKWSDYIPTDTRYGNGHGSYEWYDENNTELAFVKPTIDSWWGISGHAGISNYVGNDIKAEGDEPSNLFMRDLEAFNVSGGANGSQNFCTHYGYLDPEEYASIYSPEGVLPGIQFSDGQARVIDHMYVTNTTYAYAVLISGEKDFGGDYEYTDETTFKIVAYGYDSFEDTEPTSTEFYLLNTGKRMITDWTKWDLSVLGEVVRVEFNLIASADGYGDYGNVIPAYFAYDDVAVRFPIE